MRVCELTFSNVVDSLLLELPILEEYVERWPKGEDGKVLPYIVFDLVVRPYAESVLHGKGRVEMRVIGEFFEKMASSSDAEVVNLLDVCVLEEWVKRPRVLSRALPLMGRATRNLIEYRGFLLR